MAQFPGVAQIKSLAHAEGVKKKKKKRIKHSFMIKPLIKVEFNLNKIKTVYDKPTGNIRLNSEN